jgi:thiol-disulfide isomerase/thioredoxin
MAKAMETKKQTKLERRRAAAEAREAARRRQARRRTLGYALGGVALIAVVVLVVFASMGGEPEEGSDAVRLSQPGQVSIAGDARSEPIGAGEVVPDFSAPAVGGGSIDWSAFEGSPVVLPVWAPWCSHCQVELPLLDRVMQDYPGVELVTIVTAIGDQPGPDAGVFMADNDITAPTAIDDTTRKLASGFGIQGFPTLFFIGSDGVVVRQMSGEVDEATLRQVIGSLS